VPPPEPLLFVPVTINWPPVMVNVAIFRLVQDRRQIHI